MLACMCEHKILAISGFIKIKYDEQHITIDPQNYNLHNRNILTNAIKGRSLKL